MIQLTDKQAVFFIDMLLREIINLRERNEDLEVSIMQTAEAEVNRAHRHDMEARTDGAKNAGPAADLLGVTRAEYAEAVKDSFKARSALQDTIKGPTQ